jgi:uncharacterized protein YcbX
VKSAAGIALDRAEVDEFGIRFDRRWMVVDAGGSFMTQREHPRLALIRTSIAQDRLVLSLRGMPDLELPLVPTDTAEREIVTVWRDQVPALPQGAEAARWLSEGLSTPCRLVFLPRDVIRPVRVGDVVSPARVGFADAFPFLLVTGEALDALNARLEQAVSIDRFRPNIVVAGATPHAEDRWQRIRIGEIAFDVVKPCSRCVTITVDPHTGKPGSEPLRTLAGYRMEGRDVNFGQNLVHLSRGWLQVGDEVEVVVRREGEPTV